MAETQVQHESLLLPGYWRITAFGKLTENPRAASPDLRIRTYLAPLEGTADKSATGGIISGQIRPLLLPVGEIPRLYLNAILHDGRLVAHRIHHLKHEQIVTRTLDCRRGNLRVFRRLDLDERGDLIIPVRDKWAHLLDDPELHGLFVAIGTPDDPYATVITAVEIFRFFYATSDVLAKAFLRDHFLDPDTNLWNVEKTGLLNDGRGVIWLRKKMLDADASFLARFAFDDYALRQAQRIFLHSSATGRPGGERTLWAAPPFEDIVTTKLVCLPIEGPNGKRMLVTRLISCDWKPPWIELKWDRDNDGRKDPDNREERDPTNWAPSFLTVQNGDIVEPARLANIPPSGANVPSRLKESEICERFPELGKIRPVKLPQKDTTTRAKQRDWKPIASEAYPGSVIEGISSTQCVGRTIIEGLDQKPETRSEITDQIDTIVGREDYRLVLDLMKAIADFSLAKVEFVVVLDAKASIDGVEFNVFPDELDGKKKPWLYVDGEKTNRRMVLIASVEHEGRLRYIIELQRKKKGECSTLVAWDHEERLLSPGFLAQLVMDCARVQGTDLVSAQRLNVIWGRLRHTTVGTDKASAQHFLQRILTAKLRFKKRLASEIQDE